jgi:hypothetical protein
MAADKSDRLILIAEARDLLEANVWKDALEQEGIKPFVKSLDVLKPMGVAPSGGFELYVLEKDEKRARWVLGEGGPSK